MNTTGGDPSFLRRFNSSAVLRALHLHGRETDFASDQGLTVSQLAAAVNVSRPTAEEAAESLYAAGWIELLPPQTSDRRSAGRPARRFRYQPTAGFVLGIDIEAVWVSAAVADLAGRVIGRARRSAPAILGARERLATVGAAIDAAVAAAEVEVDRILGAVVGTTGIVGPEGSVRRNNLPGWEGLNLAAEVSTMIDVPVTVQNHLRLSALGELWRGAAQESDDVVHLHAGQRMGVGVVIDGKPLLGFHGAAGEFVRASSEAWLEAYRTLLQHPLGVMVPDLSAGLGGDIGDAGPIFDAAATGDTAARQAVEEFARALIADIAPVIAAFDPEVVVIGGDLARAADVSIAPAQQVLDVVCLFPPTVRVSQLGEESITLGAIRIALDEVETRLFEPPYDLGLD